MAGSRSAGRSDPRTDAELLAATQSDAEAFGVFYDRHFRSLFGYFWVRTRDGEVAADLCAETFATVLSQLASFDPTRGNPSQWMYGIAGNLLKRFWRTTAASRRARDKLGIQVIDLRVDISEEFVVAEAGLDSERLHSALERLPARYRQAVRLRVVQEMPYAEIADRIGCSNNTARVRVLRGLKRLRTEFESGGDRHGSRPT